MRTRFSISFSLLAAGALAGAGQAAVVPGFVVAKQGDAVSGSTISSLNTPFTDGNGVVSFVAGLADNNRIVWKGAGPIFNSSSALPDVLTGGESTMGSGNAGQFIYSPSFNGADAVYTNGGKLLADDDPIPGHPGLFSAFNSRPQMGPDGTAYWVGGYATAVGGSTVGRMMLRATDPTDPGTIQVLNQTGDTLDGFNIGTTGVGFDYQFSDNAAHRIQTFILETGSTAHDDFVYVDGVMVAREDSPTGQGDDWDNFDNMSINNAGNYIFTGDTDGASGSDEFIAYNGAIVLREGATVDGRLLGASLNGAAINDNDDMVFIWNTDLTESLFFGPAADPSMSIALLSVGDELDLDGDTIGDWLVTDFNPSNVIGPGLDLAEDGYVYVEVDIQPIDGGASIEAVIRLVVPEPSTLSLLALAALTLCRRRR